MRFGWRGDGVVLAPNEQRRQVQLPQALDRDAIIVGARMIVANRHQTRE
jgi:hypothetical protein